MMDRSSTQFMMPAKVYRDPHKVPDMPGFQQEVAIDLKMGSKDSSWKYQSQQKHFSKRQRV